MKFRFKKGTLKGNIVGETDFDKHLVKINKKMAKKDGELGLTIFHEMDHIKHPKKHEKTVYNDEKEFHKLSKKQKSKYYGKV